MSIKLKFALKKLGFDFDVSGGPNRCGTSYYYHLTKGGRYFGTLRESDHLSMSANKFCRFFLQLYENLSPEIVEILEKESSPFGEEIATAQEALENLKSLSIEARRPREVGRLARRRLWRKIMMGKHGEREEKMELHD